MAEWIAKIAELVKLPTKTIAAVAVVTGALLAAPPALLDRLHLSDLVSKLGPYLGAAFIGASALLTVELVWWAAGFIKEKRQESRARGRALKSLQSLDYAERAVLREFLIQGQNTLHMFVTAPVVAGLMEKGILEQVGPYGQQSYDGIAVPLTVAHELREKVLTPDFLGLPAGEPTEEERLRIIGERPSFVRALERRRARRAL
jgi:hypothetical protein